MESLKKDGYLVLRNLLTPQEKKHFCQMITEMENWPVSDDKWFTYYENVNGERLLSRLEGFYEHHSELKKLVEGKLGQAASDCLGEQGVVFKDKINFKRPGGIGYDAHQDGAAWTLYGQYFHMSALVPADPMTMQNGCLKLVAGDWGKLPWLPLDENGDVQEEVAKKFKWDPITCDAGTVVFFNSHVPHKSDVNETNESRRALYITWNAESLGDRRADFYSLRREMHPSDHMRDPNKDYSEGIKLFSEEILEMGNDRLPKANRGKY